MFLKKIASLFSGEQKPDAVTKSSNEIDITQLPLFRVMDDTIRYMIVDRKRKIREFTNVINEALKEDDRSPSTKASHYEIAASLFVELKKIDPFNNKLVDYQRDSQLMLAAKNLPIKPDDVLASFRQVSKNPELGKNMFELTDHGYRFIVSAEFMPNRADRLLKDAWRSRVKTSEDNAYYEAAKQIIYYYYLRGFDNVTHPKIK